jgi:hypothetical protein
MTNEAATAQNQSGRSGSLRVLVELYRVNETYIREVVDASRKILQTVLDGLVPGNHLKHCPLRTFFRILSGMIFILKVFILQITTPRISDLDYVCSDALNRHSLSEQRKMMSAYPWIFKIGRLKRCEPASLTMFI